MRTSAALTIAALAWLAWLICALAIEQRREAQPQVPAWHAQLQICAPVKPNVIPPLDGPPPGKANRKARCGGVA
jgi:hypothetical protein